MHLWEPGKMIKVAAQNNRTNKKPLVDGDGRELLGEGR